MQQQLLQDAVQRVALGGLEHAQDFALAFPPAPGEIAVEIPPLVRSAVCERPRLDVLIRRLRRLLPLDGPRSRLFRDAVLRDLRAMFSRDLGA